MMFAIINTLIKCMLYVKKIFKKNVSIFSVAVKQFATGK